MKFHVLCVFLTAIWCFTGLQATAAQVLPPRITPGKGDLVPLPNTPHYLTNETKRFGLLCEGQRPVNWTIPPVLMFSEVSEKNLSTWKQQENIKFPYAAHLLVKDSKYEDTGYYYCSYDSDNLQSEDVTTSVYVYVSSKENLLVGDNGVNSYQAMQYKSVLIDCRPTSPDVNISLWLDSLRVDVTHPTDDHGVNVTFDPTRGYTLANLNPINSGPYECKGELGGETETIDGNIHVLTHTDSVPKPRIIGESMVADGGSLVLTCNVTVDLSTYFTLNWTVPDPRALTEGRIKINATTVNRVQDRNGIHRKTGSGVLNILKASKTEEGEFTCIVKDHAQNKNSATKTIQVISVDEQFINLTTDVHDIDVTAGENAKWVIDIAAYPKVVNVSWFSPQLLPISSSPKFIFKWPQPSPTQAILEIIETNIKDSGTYQLRAMNENNSTILKLKLIVRDKPAIILTPEEPESYYFFGKSYELNCRVIGYPKPDIEWFFKPCDDFPKCSGSRAPVPPSKISKEVEINGTFVSTLNWKAERSGYLTCQASNSEGDAEEERDIWVTDVLYGFHLSGKEAASNAIEGDNITLNCGASNINYTSVQWQFNARRDAPDILITDQNPPNLRLNNKTTQFSYQKILTITNITKRNNGSYICKALADSSDFQSEQVLITVADMQKPVIIKSEMDDSELSVSTDDKVEWTCDANGVPKPKIMWYKNNEELQISKDNNIYELLFDNRTLQIKYQSPNTEGRYSCKASNRAGVAERFMTIKYINTDKAPSIPIIVTIIFFVILVAGLIAVLLLRIRKEQKLRNEMRVAGLTHFEEGALDCINPELPIDDQAELLPYDKKWEFPRDKLKLGKQLGAGAFGIVMKAEAIGIHDEEAITTVAVKMVKRNAEYTYIKALASELKIMVHLGKHLNVVNLLGACTKNLTKRELLVIVEYCRFGNLHNYLLRHRADFIDQVDPNTGQIDPTVGADILARHESINSKSSGEMSVDYRAPSSNSSGSNTEMTNICMTPTGDEGCMLSNNSIQPEWRSNYHGDYKGNVRPICTRDLLCWAFQVARGMEYLAGRKVLHGDLAARNILLADNNVVKICDFGLAKSMYKSDNYRKKGDGPLPVKWMAIESIRDRIFSTQSDVWSFGIVLWEFFSLARTPYPGMEADEKLYIKLVEGYRMDKPEYATKEVYETIENCWLTRPNERPTFSDLAEQLGNMLEESVRMHYIDLNGPYMDMNTIWKAGNQSDYLAMMSAPTYGNLVSPIGEEEDSSHAYVNSNITNPPLPDVGETSGYLCMKSPDSVIFSPRPTSPPVFSFSPESQRLRSGGTTLVDELKPMLSGGNRGSDSDNEYKSPNNTPQLVNNLNKDTQSNVFSNDKEDKTKQNISPSFSNPSYQTMGPMINPTPDNYVNMPQQKLGSKTDLKNTDVPVSFSNPNYLAMGKVEGLSDSSKHNLIPNVKGAGNESYVNLPSHGRNLSNDSSGFQSSVVGESPYVN